MSSEHGNGEPDIPSERPIEVPSEPVTVDIPPDGPVEAPQPPSEIPLESPKEVPPIFQGALLRKAKRRERPVCLD